MIEIKRWDTGEVIYSGKYESIKDCLESGVSKGISFFRAKLNDAKLNGAKLNGAKLNGAKLNGAKLNGAKLNYAELNGAKLNGAKLNYAELNYAKLNDAELNDAELNYAKLNYAELNDAELNYAKLNDAELPELSVYMPAGEDYRLFISPAVVQAGCKAFSPESWRNFTKEEIAGMDGKKALKFFPRLLDLMDFFLGEGERPEWLND